MIITVASFKGGVAKTTTAVHLAAYLQRLAPTLLLDGDPNRQALVWDAAGQMPFKVADILQSAKHAADYGVGRGHVVIDTEARPGPDDFKALAEGCDLLVIPAAPRAVREGWQGRNFPPSCASKARRSSPVESERSGP